ncbi:hypothetical protein scyTo_0013279 [Scyliorhinus torazame]|uniref:Uncharacterized protein n=1 Tax=Scyliorhinus torazame TaxID=75743 RepID=A0A401NT88_SCYTO|nr:hypothetical protein [Scyliorhinus torazame]
MFPMMLELKIKNTIACLLAAKSDTLTADQHKKRGLSFSPIIPARWAPEIPSAVYCGEPTRGSTEGPKLTELYLQGALTTG